MNTLHHYLSEVRKIHSLGSAPETSYYPALAELLTTIGMSLSPKVRCIVHPKNLGSGIPDMALFSHDQLPAGDEPLQGVLPSRGVIEAKGAGEPLDRIISSPQVEKYFDKYGQVLVTNLREFALVATGNDGKAQTRERFTLAETEAAFWDPSRTDDSQHTFFVNYIKRVLISQAPILRPKDLAWLLASYARDALGRVERSDLEALTQLRRGMEEALGIDFKGERGDHFFRSTFVQTIFYGIFSAWVLWHRRGAKGPFDWRTSAWHLRVPMITALFYQASDPRKLEPLGLVEILDWTGDALNRVERDAFFERFEADQAVQYFYEPFLEAFDPELRRELGVWYTPREIVRYQVARVDTVLREELGVADGLADPSVVVLDPCCGTGAYLVEVLRVIHRRILERGDGDILALNVLKKAAMERVFGFEILPAPFVVAHLQLGLLLQEMGASLSAVGNERVGVYLTNSLTGWDGVPPQKAMIFPELMAERDAAARVKLEAKILVVIGNPPYNGFAGIAMDEERALTDAYRITKEAPRPQGQGLNDLYIRFYRMAERRIVEQTGVGVVCFISNYSWLDGLSFTGMRERYIEVFDKIWIDNLHGDRIISEYAPDGRTSETVFAAAGGFVGIRIGTSIATLVRKSPHTDHAIIQYRDWQQAKANERRSSLLASINGDKPIANGYFSLKPVLELGLPLKPRAVTVDYINWWSLPDLFPAFFPGVKSSRDDVVVDIDLHRLRDRIRAYFDKAITDEQMTRIAPDAMANTPRFRADKTRDFLRNRGVLQDNFIRYSYRPFDTRWLYWEPETKLLDEKRAEYVMHAANKGLAMVAQQIPRRAWSVPQVITHVGCLDIMDRSATIFPLKLKAATSATLFASGAATDNPDGTNWNLSDAARTYLNALDAPYDALFFHAIAIMHSAVYRADNTGALRQDWPRIPLPLSREALDASATLGQKVAALLDTEVGVDGVTQGVVRSELQGIGLLTRNDGKTGIDGDDLAITAGWGNTTKTGVMPAKGKLVWCDAAPNAPRLLGTQTCDVYLNDVIYWKNLPEAVWRYTLGGYQVIKKWLSYREKGVLGRNLKTEEAREVQQMARRIAALILLGDALDENYTVVKIAANSDPKPA